MARTTQNMKSKGNKLDNSVFGIFDTILTGVPWRSNRGWLGYCSIVLFPLDGDWALFDTGHYNDRALLREALNKRGIEPDDIRHVILSHLHFDHVLNLPLFKNAEVILCEEEIQYAERVTGGLEEDDAIPDFWPALIDKRKIHLVKDVLNIGEGLEAVRLPGHTPGCLSLFYTGNPTVAVCGDVVKNGWEYVTGGATAQSRDHELSRKSTRIIEKRGGVIIPGHDRPFKKGNEGIEYLGEFSWEIYGNFFPRPQNEIIYAMDLKGGFYQLP